MSGYRVFAALPGEINACFYYRIIQPMSVMEQLGLPVECMLDRGDGQIRPERSNAMFLESDISLIYQAVNKNTSNMMNATKDFKPLKDGPTGDMRWPPTFVADTDDDLFNVMPLSIAYGQLGSKRPDGTPLEDNDEIGIAHPTDIAPDKIIAILEAKYPNPIPGMKAKLMPEETPFGEDGRYIFCADSQWHNYISLWRDNDNFSIKNNRERLAAWTDVVKAAQLVTCSTKGAEAYIKREIGADIRTFVTPNSVSFNEYYKIDLRNHTPEIRILWSGSATHHEDLWPLNNAIARVAAKYPQATFCFFGAPYKWATKSIPEDRLTLIPWVPFESYNLRLSTIGHDITIAPLCKSVFNASRSALKWYESSALPTPAAVLAQNTGGYAEEIVDGETGMLFDTPDEFEEKLGALIEQEVLRKTLSCNAKDWVRDNRDPRKVVLQLFYEWSKVREEHKQTMPVE